MISLGISSLWGQTTLEFNQVLLIDNTNGVVTVPAGRVWKIEANGLSAGVYFSDYTGYSTTWSATNPNPCTGATSGSSGSIPYLYKNKCSDANNSLVINGKKIRLSGTSPLWLPAGTTLRVSSTPCVNTLSQNIPANSPYAVADRTVSPEVTYRECDGPINQGVVSNSILCSIIEFNVNP